MTSPSPEQRFWSKVDPCRTDGCWHWTAAHNGIYYGVMGRYGKNVLAHRFSYELLRGPIPKGLEIDHLCRVSLCVNPDHLEPVTHGENIRRGMAGSLVTHCPQGHEYTPANTHIHHGWRDCRACDRIRHQAKRDAAR